MENNLQPTDKKQLLLQRYPKELPNSIKLVSLVNTQNINSAKTLMQLMTTWKTGISIHRPSFNTIKAYCDENGRAELIKAIHNKLWELTLWVKVDNKLTEIECYELAVIILEKYRTLSLEDFLLFIKKAKSFEYGKVYNRFDSEVILDWLRQYDLLVDEQREINHRNVKAGIKDKFLDVEIIKNSYDKLLSNKNTASKLPKPKNPYKSVTKLTDKEDTQGYAKFKADFIRKRQEAEAKRDQNQDIINKTIEKNK